MHTSSVHHTAPCLPGRNSKTKGACNCCHIQAVHVEDLLELVAVVGKDVGSVCILGTLVQVIVLLNKALQLALHVGNLAGRELILVQGDLGLQ